jgi:hypothetical protein
MDTKLKGDLAEQAAAFHAMKHGWGVLRPLGDRLPYDLSLTLMARWSKFRSSPRGLMDDLAIMW